MWPLYLFIGLIALLWSIMEYNAWRYRKDMAARIAEIRARKARQAMYDMAKGVSVKEMYDWSDELRITK